MLRTLLKHPLYLIVASIFLLAQFFLPFCFRSPSTGQQNTQSKCELQAELSERIRAGRFSRLGGCVGDDVGPDLWRTRSCHLQNVCYERESQKWIYYFNPDVPLPFYGKPFPSRFLVQLRKDDFNSPNYEVPWGIHMREGKIPSHAKWATRLHHCLFSSFWAENWGHALMDDVFPLYRLLRKFDAWACSTRSQRQVWLQRPCHSNFGANTPDGNRACMLLNFFSQVISDVEMQPVKEGDMVSAPLVCVPNLYVGVGIDGTSYRSDVLWKEFIQETAQALGLKTMPEKRKVLFVKKSGRRSVTNMEEMVQKARSRFSNVEILYLNPALLGQREQLELIRTVSAVVSPCGGISLFSAFLNEGCSRILIDYFDPVQNRSGKMESYVWQWDATARTLYYPLERSEISFPSKETIPGFDKMDEFSLFRNYGRPTLSFQKLEPLLINAIDFFDAAYLSKQQRIEQPEKTSSSSSTTTSTLPSTTTTATTTTTTTTTIASTTAAPSSEKLGPMKWNCLFLEAGTATCQLEDVCFDARNRVFHFVETEGNKFPYPALELSGRPSKRSEFFFTRIKNVSLVAENITWFPHLDGHRVVASFRHSCSNAGHCIAETTIPLFRMMDGFNLTKQTAQILLFDSCHDASDKEVSMGSPETCRKNEDTIRALSSVEIAFLRPQKANPKWVCFRNIIVGNNLGPFVGAQWKKFSANGGLSQFRTFLRNSLNISVPPPSCSNPIVLTVWKRQGRRRIRNYAALSKALQNVTISNVTVTELDLSVSSLKQQLELCAKASVVISAPGSASFVSLWLSDHSTLITAPMCWMEAIHPDEPGCIAYEVETVHKYAQHYSTVVFPASLNDLIPSENDNQNFDVIVEPDWLVEQTKQSVHSWFVGSNCDCTNSSESPSKPLSFAEEFTLWLQENPVGNCSVTSAHCAFSRNIVLHNVLFVGSSVTALAPMVETIQVTWGRRLRNYWFFDKLPQNASFDATTFRLEDLNLTGYDLKAILPLNPTPDTQHFFKTWSLLDTVSKWVLEKDKRVAGVDWFLKGFEDTYPITENFATVLSRHNASEAVVLGEQQCVGSQVFLGGGAGWFISRGAMEKMNRLESCAGLVNSLKIKFPFLGWRADDVYLSFCFREVLKIRVIGVPGMYMFPPSHRKYTGIITPRDLSCRNPVCYKDNPEVSTRPDLSLKNNKTFPLTFHNMKSPQVIALEKLLYSDDGLSCRGHSEFGTRETLAPVGRKDAATSQKGAQSKCAYLFNAPDDHYAVSAIVAIHRLRDLNVSIPIVFCHTGSVSEFLVSYLRDTLQVLIRVTHAVNEHSYAPFRHSFQKIFDVWTAVDFQRVIYMDSDLVPLKNLDHMCNFSELSAVDHIEQLSKPGPPKLTSSFFVAFPSFLTLHELNQIRNQWKGELYGDMEVIQTRFQNFTILPLEYEPLERSSIFPCKDNWFTVHLSHGKPFHRLRSGTDDNVPLLLGQKEYPKRACGTQKWFETYFLHNVSSLVSDKRFVWRNHSV